MKNPKPISTRGALSNPDNPFSKTSYGISHWEGIDLIDDKELETEIQYSEPKTIINKVSSPDIGMTYSVNPYQGCEHGCSYCYARNSHFYWGLSAGQDFESKLIVKKNAAELLKKELSKKNWKVAPISLSGNTDCYQPIERKLGVTRSLLEVLQDFNCPTGIITKNALILRDLDILSSMAKKNLVKVYMSITTLDEHLRRVMEPRTSTIRNRFEAVHRLTQAGIPVVVMCAPIIPGLNNHHIPGLLRKASEMGACGAAYTLVRLNGAVSQVFEEWIRGNFPDRANKVLNQIKQCHAGKLNDSRFGKRMTGEGPIADEIRQLFQICKKRYFTNVLNPTLDCDLFNVTTSKQLSLF